MLPHPGRFFHKDTGFFPVKIIQKRNCVLIKIAHIGIQVHCALKLKGFLTQLLKLHGNAVGLFCLKLPAQLFFQRLSFLFDPLHSFPQTIPGKQKLTCRVNCDP